VLGGRPTLGSVPRALPDVLESAPDSVLDGGTAGGLIARAASLRGDDHRYEGEGRQDSVGLWPLACDTAISDTGSVLLAAVADGVGSLPLSHLGSAAACRLVRRHAAERLEALVETERTAALVSACRDTAADIAAGMRAAADERGLAAERLATTLVAALVVPAAEGRSARATVFAVGDSSASVLRDGVWWPCLPVEDGTETAEVANAPTYALPAHARQVAVAVTPLQSGDVLALCSDGLARPMLNASVRDRLAEWWGGGRVPSLPEFYWQLSFRAQTFGDDRSVVCVWVP
jgi:serine/threonine protein phosphatase PrpC